MTDTKKSFQLTFLRYYKSTFKNNTTRIAGIRCNVVTETESTAQLLHSSSPFSMHINTQTLANKFSS